MSARTILFTILLAGFAFAGVGGLVGAVLGAFAPGYYRTVFAAGGAPDFHPIQLGIGLGVTQGFALGLALSISAVAIQAGREICLGTRATEQLAHAKPAGNRHWMIPVAWALTALILVSLVGATTFVAGGIVGQQQLYQAWTNRKLETLASILTADEYRKISAESSSAVTVYLTGTVENDAVRGTLREQLTMAFGIATADEMIENVQVDR
jgi:hypothetical protein